MFAFNATSSTFAIKQNDVLFIFFDNVKNTQKEKNIFYDAIESFVQNITAVLNNTKWINVDDSENAFAMSSFKSFFNFIFCTFDDFKFDFRLFSRFKSIVRISIYSIKKLERRIFWCRIKESSSMKDWLSSSSKSTITNFRDFFDLIK